MVVLRRHPRIAVRCDADLLQGVRGSSARADMNLRIRVENGGNQKVNFVLKMLKD